MLNCYTSIEKNCLSNKEPEWACRNMNIDSDYSMRVDPFQRHVFTYIYIGSSPTLSVGYTCVYGVNIVTRAFDCNFGYHHTCWPSVLFFRNRGSTHADTLIKRKVDETIKKFHCKMNM